MPSTLLPLWMLRLGSAPGGTVKHLTKRDLNAGVMEALGETGSHCMGVESLREGEAAPMAFDVSIATATPSRS